MIGSNHDWLAEMLGLPKLAAMKQMVVAVGLSLVSPAAIAEDAYLPERLDLSQDDCRAALEGTIDVELADGPGIKLWVERAAWQVLSHETRIQVVKLAECTIAPPGETVNLAFLTRDEEYYFARLQRGHIEIYDSP